MTSGTTRRFEEAAAAERGVLREDDDAVGLVSADHPVGTTEPDSPVSGMA